jgi:uncharacterized membrane protein
MSGSGYGGFELPPSMKLARGLICFLALAAASVAAYLLYLSISADGLPLGCGAGSSCAEVLTSRWSQVLGIPVSGLALVVYLGIATCVFLTGPKFSLATQRIVSPLLWILVGVVAASAVWFLGLQFLILKSVCFWCLVEHAFGLAICGLIIWTALSQSRSIEAPPDAARAFLGAGGGWILVGSLVAAQMLGDHHTPGPTRLPIGINADSGPGAGRIVAVLDGTTQLSVHDLPMLGSVDAPKLLVMLFDYCCPHCRATHGYLGERLPQYSGQLGVILLPTPLNSACNPYWEETDPRFRDSCELASLALAVWKVDPDSFAKFNAWLFEPETPRAAQEARAYAEQLVPTEKLEAALGDKWISERIAHAVQAFRNSRADRIPVIMSPGMAAVVGRPESADELFQLLDSELQLKPVAAISSTNHQ